MLKTRGLFITGTDTDVGKTHVAALIAAAARRQEPICYFKPVQSGAADSRDLDFVKERAELSAEEVVPSVYEFQAPLSPNRAAALENASIAIAPIEAAVNSIKDRFVIVEGAGGLEVPLNEKDKISDLARSLDLPVVIVASTKLGTINHTLLSVARAKALGLPLLGVILNGKTDQGLRELLESEGVPILFEIPYLETSEEEAAVIQKIEKRWNTLSTWKTSQALGKKDQHYVWHPFTQHGWGKTFETVLRGRGSELTLGNGKTVVDGISSWWVNLHGHAHPEIARAIAEQAGQLEHVIFAGYTHEPAVRLAESLINHVQKTQPQLAKTFYSDNGSTSVEVALKMAYQFQVQSGRTERKKFLALRGSYHGDTLAAMSTSERDGFHRVFTPLMPTVDFVSPDNFLELETLPWEEYAAFIFEPLVQGSGGMRFYSSDFLQAMALQCRRHQVLMIADEVFTGFYRTGTFLACDQAMIKPDLVCLSKGITGGFLPLAVTLTTDAVYQGFEGPHLQTAFLHGHSYTANPIACAAANKSFELLLSVECQQSIARLSEWTQSWIEGMKQYKLVRQARYLGTIGAFEVSRPANYFSGTFAQQFSQACLDKGALVRPLGNTVYTLPPYSTTVAQFDRLVGAIEHSVSELKINDHELFLENNE